MRIKRIINQHRRDFRADYECEHCGHVKFDEEGYDDDNFHKNVIPAMKCEKCSKTADEDYRPMGTKYVEGVQV